MRSVYIHIPQVDRGLQRISDAIVQHSPEVTFVDRAEEADTVIVFVIGRRKQNEELVRKLKEQGKKVAIIQISLRSTKEPSTKSWIKLWKSVDLVWSTYDLRYACYEDGTNAWFEFYYAPFGSDPKVFYKSAEVRRDTTVTTCSHSYLTESVKECHLAVEATGGLIEHLGSDTGRGITFHDGITDEQIRALFNRSKYVSGLRRVEGFELPAVEGLLCGSRPLLFDYPDYRQWYGDLAEYLPDVPREKLIEELVKLFQGEYREVTEEEIKTAQHIFDWNKVIEGFWARL